MTRDPSLRSGLHPSIVLSAYIEPLVRGRRVAILGDATIGLADELSERGARLVHAYDPDMARVAEALARATPARPHQVSYAVLTDDLGVRDGAFDVVVVPDLSLFADAADVLRRTRRLVAASGAAVFVAPNLKGSSRRLVPLGQGTPRAPGYYELFDLVSLQFPKVRMIGQAPFVGYTVADFAPSGEPEVSVDTSLLTASEEPEHFIAVASDRPVTLDAFAVIELPWSEVADAIGGPDTAKAPLAERAALAEAEQRLALAVAELEKLREKQAEETRDAEARASKWAALSARVGELEGEVDRRDTRLKESEVRAGDNHVRAERLTHQIRDLEEELVRQRERATRLSKQLDDEKRARTKAEVELGMLRGKPEIAGGKDRIDVLTAELEVTRARIAELEIEQTETRRRYEPPAPPLVLPPPAPPDTKLIHRLNELEQAVNAALREASEAASQRDAALERARKAEARLERVTELEAAVETLRGEKTELLEHARVLENRGSEAERRRSEAERQRGEAERQLVDAHKQAAALIARIDTAERRVSGDEHRAVDATQRITEIEQRAQAAEQRAQAAEQRVQAAEQRAQAAELRALTTQRDAAEADRRRAESERRVAEAERKQVEAASRAAEASARVAEAATRAGEAATRAAGAEQRVVERDKRVVEHEKRIAEQERRIAELERGLSEAQQRLGAVDTDKSALEAAGAEVTALESALLERGRAVAALQRDLREAERIGKELLDEVAVHAMNGAAVAIETPAPLPAADGADLRGRLDALAVSAARCEADLQAARWRIAQLERELAEAPATPREATAVEHELEQALAVARNELASLRRALAGSHTQS